MDDLIIDAPRAPEELDLAPGAPVRGIDHLLRRPPRPDLGAVVVVPVSNQADYLPHLIEALAGQRGMGASRGGSGYEAILLFSDCRDGSPEVAASAARRFPDLIAHGVDLGPGGAGLTTASARRLLMDAAARRLRAVGRDRRGAILTTAAGACPAADWLAANLAEIEAGADAVGGQVLVQPADLARLEPALRRRLLLGHTYRRLISHLEGLIDPDPDDPLPRHHQHTGASLAVTAKAYLEAGRMPLLASGEDEAFWRALRRSGARVRHSVRVRALASGQFDGPGTATPVADPEAWTGAGGPALVESPEAILHRLRLRARLRALHRAEPLNLQDLRAAAAEAGQEPRWLAARLARGRPFFRLQDAVEKNLQPSPDRVPLEDAVAGLRDLVQCHSAARSTSAGR